MVFSISAAGTVLHRFVAANFAVAEYDGAFGEAGNVGLVRHQHNGQPALIQGLKNLHDLHRGAAIEVARGLVRQQDGGPVNQGASDSHPLLLAAGKLRRKMLHALAQAHKLQRLFRSLQPLFLLQARIKSRQFHVLQRRGA